MTTGKLVESPVRGNSHAGFGGRPAETERPKSRHRAAGRPYLGQRAVDQVRRDEWNAHDRSRTKTGKWIKGTRWVLCAPRGANQPGGMKGPALGRRDGREKLGAVWLLR